MYNGHGDTVVIVDEEQEVLNTYTYDEWGNIKEETGSFENPYLYAGYYYDEETGIYYLISRYYNPILARFISEDSYRGEYTDPLSLNRYVYVSNNPLIYIDPEGYFLKESLEWIGKRTLGLVQGTGEFAFDAIIGIGKLAYNTGEFIGSGVGLAINYGIHELGFTDENTYHYLSSEYSKTFERIGNTFLNLPENMLNGIKSNFETTFNVGNFVNYLTTDNYNEIKDYSKSVVQTGVTLYGSYNVGKGIYKATHPTEVIMSQVNVTNINADKINQIGNQYSLSTINPYNGSMFKGNNYVPPIGGGGISSKIIVGKQKIEFGHGGRHLDETNLSTDYVNEVIAKDVVNQKIKPNVVNKFMIKINDKTLEYRAFIRSDDTINIGTYFIKGDKK